MKSNQLMELFGVSDIMDLPDAIMEVLLGDIDRRNDVYTRLLEMNGMDVSYDWFQEMYESELAERSQKAQLFTPPEVSKLLAGLAGAPHGGQKIHEPTAGNGGLIIARWGRTAGMSACGTILPMLFLSCAGNCLDVQSLFFY